MPRYVYREIEEDGSDGLQFEMDQRMTDEPLTVSPLSGKKVRRVYTAPNLATKYTPKKTKDKLETKNVEKAGFTKYERDKLTGTYHKTAGDKSAPDTIQRPM